MEVPVTAPRSAGGQWLGTIDLMTEVGEGQVLPIDHKSRPIPVEIAAESDLEFSGQLAACREILERQGFSVAISWIHYPLAGNSILPHRTEQTDFYCGHVRPSSTGEAAGTNACAGTRGKEKSQKITAKRQRPLGISKRHPCLINQQKKRSSSHAGFMKCGGPSRNSIPELAFHG